MILIRVILVIKNNSSYSNTNNGNGSNHNSNSNNSNVTYNSNDDSNAFVLPDPWEDLERRILTWHPHPQTLNHDYCVMFGDRLTHNSD